METKLKRILVVNSCPKTQLAIMDGLFGKDFRIRSYTNVEVALNDWQTERSHYDITIFDQQFNTEYLMMIGAISQKVKIIIVVETDKCLLNGENVVTVLKPKTNLKLIKILKEKIVELSKEKEFEK